MSDYEMPVMVRLSKEELAAALGRSPDDPELALVGGLNAVLHPISSPHSTNLLGAMAATDNTAHGHLTELQARLKPIEEKLLQRLRSNPQTAKKFLLNPIPTLRELGLIDEGLQAEIEAHRSALSGMFSPSG